MKKLSDVFWEAANLYLYANTNDKDSTNVNFHSCDAVSDACNDKSYDYNTIYHSFMNYLGCDCNGTDQFDYPYWFYPDSSKNEWWWESYSEEEQGARYLWLMFCYEYAKELEDNVPNT